MLENIGVRHLGPAEAALLLDKRLKGDRQVFFGNLSAAAAASENGGGSGTSTAALPVKSEEKTDFGVSFGDGGGEGGGEGGAVSVSGVGIGDGFGRIARIGTGPPAPQSAAVPSFG